MDSPTTLSGAKLLSCDLDAACETLDCDAVMKEYTQTLTENSEGAEFVAHFCGLSYLDKLTPRTGES